MKNSVRNPTKARRDELNATARALLGNALGFRDCLPAIIADLVDGGSFRVLGKGEVLVRRGEIFDVISVVVEGSLEVSVLDGDGRRHLVHFLQPGDIAGLVPCLDGEGHINDLTARDSGVVVLNIPGSHLRSLREKTPQLSLAFEKQLALRSRVLYERLAADARIDLKARLARLILILSNLYGKVGPEGMLLTFKTTQSDFADLLGVSRQRASLGLQQLQRENLIKLSYASITITDVAALRVYADDLRF